jgi:hypothetical protein
MNDKITAKERLSFTRTPTQLFKIYHKNRQRIIKECEKSALPIDFRKVHLESLKIIGGY